ncbi:4-phosphoerythronate dehydrogenase [Brumicola blandensis]|uniref:Erythronate-4-phosphate dehydrogenase n=1 Tax=Brumicola blandensis TaxID=3075611 RepID=A0AAW8QZ72_9ALTE|nr:4-phosphoerythronate dehydrogenase [Alteromonas sp. W409]MDT0581900.1 4-phosphoerythronate dehydrogenase [Alteromonas sp. W409]
MKIIYDNAMPYADEFFSDLGVAESFTAGELRTDQLRDVDALFVRSTTKVDGQLLSEATRLRFVATATAGFNHLDTSLLKERGIKWYAAGGCNAVAVAEYVLNAIYHLAKQDGFIPQDKTVAIVGAGNVGSAVAERLRILGISCALYDPPLEKSGDPRAFVSFDSVMQADVICLHTPLVDEGEFPTRDMFELSRLSQLRKSQYLINACRGEVVNNQDLLSLFEQGRALNIVLDVWEHEPLIEKRLIPYLRLATAHIAGHSIEGKARGTSMVYDAFCAFSGTPITKQLSDYLPIDDRVIALDSKEDSFHQVFHMLKHMYDIEKDDGNFRSRMAKSEAFAEIRQNYPQRRECSAAKVHFNGAQSETNNNKTMVSTAAALGFLIAN